MMNYEMYKVMKKLKINRFKFSEQQYRTIKGQILSGNILEAEKGICNLLLKFDKKVESNGEG